MELWGAYLLLCLCSLLPQAATETPAPKVKKSANVKKGKEGNRPLFVFQGAGPPPCRWSSGSCPFWMNLEN